MNTDLAPPYPPRPPWLDLHGLFCHMRLRWYLYAPLFAIWAFAYARLFIDPTPRLPLLFNWTPSLPYEPKLVLTHRYLSDTTTLIYPAVIQPGYHLFDARLSGTVSGVEATLYVNNIADERGVTVAYPSGGLLRQYLVRPRTIGVTLGWSF